MRTDKNFTNGTQDKMILNSFTMIGANTRKKGLSPVRLRAIMVELFSF